MALSPKTKRKRMRLRGREKKCVAFCGEGEHGETGYADKEAALLMQATYRLQKATDMRARGKKCIEEN